MKQQTGGDAKAGNDPSGNHQNDKHDRIGDPAIQSEKMKRGRFGGEMIVHNNIELVVHDGKQYIGYGDDEYHIFQQHRLTGIGEKFLKVIDKFTFEFAFAPIDSSFHGSGNDFFCQFVQNGSQHHSANEYQKEIVKTEPVGESSCH